MSQEHDATLRRARLSDLGPALGQQAKTAYRARLRDLEEELTEATQWADPARAAIVRRARRLGSRREAGE